MRLQLRTQRVFQPVDMSGALLMFQLGCRTERRHPHVQSMLWYSTPCSKTSQLRPDCQNEVVSPQYHSDITLSAVRTRTTRSQNEEPWDPLLGNHCHMDNLMIWSHLLHILLFSKLFTTILFLIFPSLKKTKTNKTNKRHDLLPITSPNWFVIVFVVFTIIT